MGLHESLAIYLLTGAAVATAVYLTDRHTGWMHAGLLFLGAWLFWPLFVPVLLSARQTAAVPEAPTAVPAHADSMAAAIGQVESELDGALSSLGGWAESVLASETDRIHELRLALAAQAARIREMDELLARSLPAELGPQVASHGSSATDATDARWSKSHQARVHNLARLSHVRKQAYSDLMATLAWIRELVSMIHLAKFTGAPASRAEELVAQIAAAIEGVSAIAWQEVSSSQGERTWV